MMFFCGAIVGAIVALLKFVGMNVPLGDISCPGHHHTQRVRRLAPNWQLRVFAMSDGTHVGENSKVLKVDILRRDGDIIRENMSHVAIAKAGQQARAQRRGAEAGICPRAVSDACPLDVERDDQQHVQEEDLLAAQQVSVLLAYPLDAAAARARGLGILAETFGCERDTGGQAVRMLMVRGKRRVARSVVRQEALGDLVPARLHTRAR